MTQDLIEKTAAAIKSLSKENKELKAKNDNLEEDLKKTSSAIDLTFKLLKVGAFPIEDLEAQLQKYLTKTSGDIAAFEKAAELLTNPRTSLSLGTISDQPQLGSGTAEERFIHQLFSN